MKTDMFIRSITSVFLKRVIGKNKASNIHLYKHQLNVEMTWFHSYIYITFNSQILVFSLCVPDALSCCAAVKFESTI